jgi:hypothetical protein
MEALPFTSWEQAVFVTLFAVFVIAVLGWVTKIQGNWQRFIQQEDEKWRDWMDKQDEKNRNTLCDVTESLDKLTAMMIEHDNKVEARINASEKYVVSETKNGKARKPAVQSS